MNAMYKSTEKQRERAKQYYYKNKDKILTKIKSTRDPIKKKIYDQQKYIKNSFKIKEKSRIYYHKNKEKRRIYLLQKNYNISIENYNNKWKEQNGCCEICKTKFDVTSIGLKSLLVDHNHSNGQVRGLLCNNCNRTLGLLKENVNTLENAISYLKKWKLIYDTKKCS